MATDFEFLDEVTAFLNSDTLPRVATPCESIESDQIFEFPVSVSESLIAIESSSEEPDQNNHKRGSGECDNNLVSSKHNPHQRDDRRQRYRTRVKNERQELKRMEKELSRKKQEIIDAREGRKTNARSDLIVSKSFWQEMANRQREEREQAEAEQNRLIATVQSQASYIENLCAILRERPSSSTVGTTKHQIDNLKWLRLKSSDTTLFREFIQEADECYARIDEVFAECAMASLPMAEIHSVRRFSLETGMEYAQYVNRILQPFSYEATCKFVWDGTDVPYRQHEREVYDVNDLENTRAIKFRLKKTLACGSTVSLLKRVVARRYVDDKRMVIVFKCFTEGEGDFSGMDTDETSWCSIRPCDNGSTEGAVLEFCSRQLPIPFLSVRKSESTLKELQTMLEDVMGEDERELISTLQNLLLNPT